MSKTRNKPIPAPEANGQLAETAEPVTEKEVRRLVAAQKDAARRVKEYNERHLALCKELQVEPVYLEQWANGQLVQMQWTARIVEPRG